MLHRQPPRGAVVGVFERQLDLMLDVASLTLPRSSPRGARSFAAEEGGEEVGEGVRITEHLLHFLLRHRAEAAARTRAAARPTCVDVPLPAGKWVGFATCLGLLVGAPIGAELVVFLPLRRI